MPKQVASLSVIFGYSVLVVLIEFVVVSPVLTQNRLFAVFVVFVLHWLSSIWSLECVMILFLGLVPDWEPDKLNCKHFKCLPLISFWMIQYIYNLRVSFKLRNRQKISSKNWIKCESCVVFAPNQIKSNQTVVDPIKLCSFASWSFSVAYLGFANLFAASGSSFSCY